MIVTHIEVALKPMWDYDHKDQVSEKTYTKPLGAINGEAACSMRMDKRVLQLIVLNAAQTPLSMRSDGNLADLATISFLVTAKGGIFVVPDWSGF